eukprot:CAMPEP_0196734834 /NCGR_PEP_ID=MMETSP1091-20130531/13463_1 /TAXON_ID=302021 /ORGANISM="Rhodomonas sp., Strain CCMP768" /LENGTH=92 /DNA_ID=CAMNT_0042078401 /DNA_START=226 /DNA_END=504 /DNA_ORIENTATION=+
MAQEAPNNSTGTRAQRACCSQTPTSSAPPGTCSDASYDDHERGRADETRFSRKLQSSPNCEGEVDRFVAKIQPRDRRRAEHNRSIGKLLNAL